MPPTAAWSACRAARIIRDLDPASLGLIPVELETWRGFLFVRLEGGGPSVAEMMAPYEAEVAPYRFEELRAIGRITLRPRDVNWKNVADNYSDGLHINVAHPGLTRLFGGDYRIEAGEHVDRMSGELVERPSANLSERAYQHFLPAAAGRRWLYFKLWPNVAIDIYPDQVDFMHFVPVGADPDADPRDRLRAAGRAPGDEGGALSQLADQPPGQCRGHRADPPRPAGHGLVALHAGAAGQERGLPAGASPRKLRRLIPETRLEPPPPPGWSGCPAHEQIETGMPIAGSARPTG